MFTLRYIDPNSDIRVILLVGAATETQIER